MWLLIDEGAEVKQESFRASYLLFDLYDDCLAAAQERGYGSDVYFSPPTEPPLGLCRDRHGDVDVRFFCLDVNRGAPGDGEVTVTFKVADLKDYEGPGSAAVAQAIRRVLDAHGGRAQPVRGLPWRVEHERSEFHPVWMVLRSDGTVVARDLSEAEARMIASADVSKHED